MWETCLKHSTEIIALVLGSGILGYLWNKWFGSSSKNDGLNKEYENQLNSLNTRLRNQDAEIKNAHSLQSSWASEKTGLLARIDELTESVDAAKHSFSGFVSPAEYKSLQTRFDHDIKTASEKVDNLTNEKLNLQKALSDYESKAKIENTSLSNKLKELEAQLQSVNNTKTNELKVLQNQLVTSSSRSGALEKEVDEYKKSIDNLKQALKGAEDQLTQRDKEYLSKLSHSQADLDAAKKSIADITAKLNQTNEANQAGVAKLNDSTARLHQLENELLQVRSEMNIQKAKTSDLDKLTSSLTETDRKAKEWEARWKDIAVEADQFKLAHANATKERDSLKQRVSQLESEIIGAKNQVEIIQKSKLDESNAVIAELQSKLDASNHELNKWQNQSRSLEAEIENQKAQVQDASLKLIESKKQYEAQYGSSEGLTQRINELENLIEIRENELKSIHSQLGEATNKVNALQSSSSHSSQQLAEAENRYKELTNRFNTVQTHLSDLQKSANSSVQQLHDFESRNKELSDRLNTLQLQLNEAHKANDTGNKHLQGIEAHNKELTNQIQLLNKQIDDHKSSESSAKHIQESSDAKYKELSTKFNTVQLQLADALRAKSHLEESINKKSEDANTKYHAEVAAWQKRIVDQEKDFANKENIYKSKISQLETATPKIVEKIVEKKIEVPKIVEKVVEKIVEVPKVVEKIVTVEKIVNLPAVVPASKTTLPSKIPAAKVSTKINIPKTVPAIKIAKTQTQIKTKPKVTAPVIDWKSVSTTFGKKIKADDHIIIEGIGPKINALLKKSKINTWTQLADTSVKDIQVILNKGGSKFSLADPSTWPRQASLAAQGKWSELKKYQDELNVGRKSKSKGSKTKPLAKPTAKVTAVIKKPVIKKVNKPVLKKVAPKPIDLSKAAQVFGKKFKEDDLKIIEGIGPKIEGLLKKGGINTWKKLASSEIKNVQTILSKAGSNYSLADPKTWPKQSALAAEGAWEKLKKMQDSLKGGVKS